jgi:hypothetical protein
MECPLQLHLCMVKGVAAAITELGSSCFDVVLASNGDAPDVASLLDFALLHTTESPWHTRGCDANVADRLRGFAGVNSVQRCLLDRLRRSAKWLGAPALLM